MEAMAAGVPAIAPDIGGISDLVSKDCGYLLPSSWQGEHLVHALRIISRDAKSPGLRFSANRKVEVVFNASVNYPQFIGRLEKL
jgi:glycosyltransferase involved in cell wall biosynthesis